MKFKNTIKTRVSWFRSISALSLTYGGDSSTTSWCARH